MAAAIEDGGSLSGDSDPQPMQRARFPSPVDSSSTETSDPESTPPQQAKPSAKRQRKPPSRSGSSSKSNISGLDKTTLNDEILILALKVDAAFKALNEIATDDPRVASRKLYYDDLVAQQKRLALQVQAAAQQKHLDEQRKALQVQPRVQAAASAQRGNMSGLHAEALLITPLTELPADVTAIAQFLKSTDDMRVPVTLQCFNHLVMSDHRLQDNLLATDGSDLPARMSTLLLSTPRDYGSALTTTLAVIPFVDHVFDCLSRYTPVKLDYLVHLNTQETETSSSSSTKCNPSPDTIIISSNCTLLIGEDKTENHMFEALADIQSKVINLNPMIYGVPYILAYTAAGASLRFHVVSRSGPRTEVLPVTPVFNLKTVDGRAQLILTLAKLYCLLARMADGLLVASCRHALFTVIETRPGNRLWFLANSVQKSITRYNEFQQQHRTCFADLQLAYKAAGAAAATAAACGELPCLVSVLPGSVLNVSHAHTLTVEIAPLGYNSTPTCEDEMRDLATACCKALEVLHNAGIVHRDLRMPNVVRLLNPGSRTSWMLIDLEDCASVPSLLPAGYQLRDWDAETLEEGIDKQLMYTESSDIHQLGVLLYQCINFSLSPLARQFVEALLTKRLTATTAQQHAWLQRA